MMASDTLMIFALPMALPALLAVKDVSLMEVH
jgi:hypothetical protein